MTDAENAIVKHLSEVIEDLANSQDVNGFMEAYDCRRVATRAHSAIKRYGPPGSAYEKDAAAVIGDENVVEQWKTEQLAAIVHALRDDYAAGGLMGVTEIVHADLFDDFLEMAQELLEKGFIGPAAVVAGAVLEEHLRKLATKVGINLNTEKGQPKSVETLGVELRKGGALSEVRRKSATAWYAQRTEGAHGRSENLEESEVERMIDGVRDFVASHPT